MLSSQDLEIAVARLNGATLQEIASEHGFHEATACRKLQEPELKVYLEQIQKDTINATAKIAADNLIYLISNYKANPCETEQERIEKSHGFKATERMAETIGILPSHTQSQFILNIFNQSNTIVSPALSEIINNLASKWDAPIDIEGVIEGEV